MKILSLVLALAAAGEAFSLPIRIIDKSLPLGQGYQMPGQSSSNKCLDGSEHIVRNSFGRVDIVMNASDFRTKEFMSGRGSVSADFLVIKGKATLSYFKNKEEFGDDLNYSFLAKAESSTQYFKPTSLSDFGRRAWLQGADYFSKECGTHYVSSKRKGALFLLNYSISSRDKSFVEKATLKIKVKVLWKKIRKTITLLNESEDTSSDRITLYAYQIGGNITSLIDILGTDLKIICDKSNAATCLDVIDRIEQHYNELSEIVLDQNSHETIWSNATKYTRLPAAFFE
ncbi:hypothetical protein [Pseudobacteriovorax antillogorgiicola]|uniref:Uncharacterized protein n=1 Tax=Pseudobacteriovorax antillogorgiicola TaxID=1513793 RepID=A0A1Y6CQW8_9BACT|nr:hypothetical protein [Pseudobacteriovorax antillogorgiicola]TCS45611.1 hypothetical protein EDD56_1273 [Pseudobacteriovorax antillogorgiicola]SMF72348.1 hypothetical protein SAMN06296036_1272 [Pseudobacteriovorax antillogorgiicola]